MAKKATSSNKIKAILTAHPAGGGVEKDWKRIAKKSGSGDTILRTFENAALGKRLYVTEYPEGRFEVESAPPAAIQSLHPLIDTDPARNRAADEYMLTSAHADDDALEDLAQRAGRALANRFVFALYMDEGVPHWHVTSLDHWRRCGFIDDRYMPGLCDILPDDVYEVMETYYEFDTDEDAVDQARRFFAAGFVWDKDFQLYVDPSNTDFINTLQKAQEEAAKPTPPAAPAP